MKVKELCTLDTQIIEKNETAQAAAKAMQEAKVGSLVVVDMLPNGDLPIGIITDRDIALKVAIHDIRPSILLVEDFISDKLLTVVGNEDVYEVLGKMRQQSVRRVPVVDKEGFLIGIISIDDILEFMVGELKEMTDIMKYEPDRVQTIGFRRSNQNSLKIEIMNQFKMFYKIAGIFLIISLVALVNEQTVQTNTSEATLISAQTDLKEAIQKGFQKGEVAPLYPYFDELISICIDDKESIYLSYNAQAALEYFFDVNPPKKFELRHSGNSKSKTKKYYIGDYFGENDTKFRIFIYRTITQSTSSFSSFFGS